MPTKRTTSSSGTGAALTNARRLAIYLKEESYAGELTSQQYAMNKHK